VFGGEGGVDIEGDGNGPEHTALEPEGLHHRGEVLLIQEPIKGGEGTRQDHLKIAQVALVQHQGGQTLRLLQQLVSLQQRKRKKKKKNPKKEKKNDIRTGKNFILIEYHLTITS